MFTDIFPTDETVHASTTTTVALNRYILADVHGCHLGTYLSDIPAKLVADDYR
jgi:hypothetical protein